MATSEIIAESEKAVTKLKELIATGRLSEGDKLPGERVLAQELGVGVARIREAILVLQTFGQLTIKRGKGVFVAGSHDNAPQDSIQWFSEHAFQMGDFMEARLLIEPAAARLAVRRATASETQEMEQIHETFERAIEREDMVALVEADREFHHTIIKATHNRVLAIIDHRLARAFEKYRVKSFSMRESRLNSLLSHRRVLKAIQERNEDAAEAEMRRHLDIAHRDMH